MPQTSDAAITTVAPSLRFVPSLSDLRLAGLGVVAIAALLAIPSWGDIALLLPTITPHLLALAAIPVFWLLAIWLGEQRITPAVIVTAGSITAAGFHCRRWWVVYEQSSIRLGLLLVMALVSLGLGLFAASDLLLRGIRDGMDPRPEASDDPARFRPLLRGPVPPGTKVCRLTRVLSPVLALVLAVLLVHVFTNPVSQVTASPPPGSLPARPTRISITPAWEKEVPGLLEMAAGAAGPVLFTDEGLTALNPTDGSVLWSYRRDRTSYLSLPSLGNESPQGSLATTSPTGRHIAFRIGSAKDLADKHQDSQDSTDKTLVYNAVTIVIEHPHRAGHRGASLQYDLAHPAQRFRPSGRRHRLQSGRWAAALDHERASPFDPQPRRRVHGLLRSGGTQFLHSQLHRERILEAIQ